MPLCSLVVTQNGLQYSICRFLPRYTLWSLVGSLRRVLLFVVALFVPALSPLRFCPPNASSSHQLVSMPCASTSCPHAFFLSAACPHVFFPTTDCPRVFLMWTCATGGIFSRNWLCKFPNEESKESCTDLIMTLYLCQVFLAVGEWGGSGGFEVFLAVTNSAASLQLWQATHRRYGWPTAGWVRRTTSASSGRRTASKF